MVDLYGRRIAMESNFQVRCSMLSTSTAGHLLGNSVVLLQKGLAVFDCMFHFCIFVK